MELSEVIFNKNFKPTDHKRYFEFKFLIGSTNIKDYQEYFERSFVEVCIEKGKFVKIVKCPTKSLTQERFLKLGDLGNNMNILKRCKYLDIFLKKIDSNVLNIFFFFRYDYYQHFKKKFLSDYDKHKYYNYLKYFLANYKASLRVLNTLIMYKNIKAKKKFISNSKRLVTFNNSIKLKPSDIPWAIQYNKNLRHRDGSNRRAIAYHLKWKNIPTLVFDFNQLKYNDIIQTNDPFLIDGFKEFKIFVNKNSL